MGAPFPTPTELGIPISPIWESAVIDGLELYVQKRIQNMDELWQRLYEKTQPTETHTEDLSQKNSTDNLEKAFQSGFDRIRDICVQIYQKIKQK